MPQAAAAKREIASFMRLMMADVERSANDANLRAAPYLQSAIFSVPSSAQQDSHIGEHIKLAEAAQQGGSVCNNTGGKLDEFRVELG